MMSRILSILITNYCLLITGFSYAQPNWSVTPSDFEYSMTMTTTLSFHCSESTDTNDIVAAFINGEVRGVQKLNTEFQDQNLAFMIIYDNVFNGSEVTFKMYDASLDSVFDATQTMQFVENGNTGNSDNPFLLSTGCTTGLFQFDDNRTAQVSIYPNPARSMVTFKADSKIDQLRLYDLSGRLVYSESELSSNSIDVSMLSPQFYTLICLMEGNVSVAKLMVEH